jgi:hypothetical protein
MKKTTSITIGVVLSALVIAGCGEDRRCVDANDIVVMDDYCDDDSPSRSSSHRWYYGGHGGYNVGHRATGGSYHSVSRGGFGSTAAAHASSGG